MSVNKAVGRIRSWRESPAKFVYEQFGEPPDKWQKEALDVFPSQDPDKIRMSLQACAGPGKSAVLAWCGLNFLACYAERGEHPKGAAVACTRVNLKDNLWTEIAKWHGRSEFLRSAFEWGAERITNLYGAIAIQLETILRMLGLTSIADLRGRKDLLVYKGSSE